MNKESRDNSYFLIVGMGATGLSIARYLQRKGEDFQFFDTRTRSVYCEKFDGAFPKHSKHFVDIEDHIVDGAEEIYLSPGVSRSEPVIERALERGKSVVGDIELFVREVRKPVVGITGSNGKSTVTTLVGLAADRASINAAIGGNIGTPALDLLDEDVELFVLELSSFQLESTFNPKLSVACNLNVSEDHMDRYDNFDLYVGAKRRIFEDAEVAVYCGDDSHTTPGIVAGQTRYTFGLSADSQGSEKHFFYEDKTGWLKSSRNENLMEKSHIKIKGTHNVKNALALFAVADAIGIPLSACVSVLGEFSGLPHRCEVVAIHDGVTFINDSKATNVGATVAAIKGLENDFREIVLIAGGDGKGADFTELANCINGCVKAVVLIGVDAEKIAAVIGHHVATFYASDMREAVNLALKNSSESDAVLLSPACASLDMYMNFEERGQEFCSYVSACTGGANAD